LHGVYSPFGYPYKNLIEADRPSGL